MNSDCVIYNGYILHKMLAYIYDFHIRWIDFFFLLEYVPFILSTYFISYK
jgi:hypothetical protein